MLWYHQGKQGNSLTLNISNHTLPQTATAVFKADTWVFDMTYAYVAFFLIENSAHLSHSCDWFFRHPFQSMPAWSMLIADWKGDAWHSQRRCVLHDSTDKWRLDQCWYQIVQRRSCTFRSPLSSTGWDAPLCSFVSICSCWILTRPSSSNCLTQRVLQFFSKRHSPRHLARSMLWWLTSGRCSRQCLNRASVAKQPKTLCTCYASIRSGGSCSCKDMCLSTVQPLVRLVRTCSLT